MVQDTMWAPPSRYAFEKHPSVLQAPNSCEKSEEYWRDCATVVAAHLDLAAVGDFSCKVN